MSIENADKSDIAITSKLLTARIWPNSKSSRLTVTSRTEIRIKPNAKKEEKIIPIEVSSPISVFLITNPRNNAIINAAGNPSSEME